MKLLLIFPLIGVTGLLASADPVEKPSMRARLAGEIKKLVSYAPPALKEPAAPLLPTPSDELVVLEPFVVTTRVDAFAHKIEERQQEVLGERFTFKHGGTILKVEGKTVTTEVKLSYDPAHDGWDILSFSW